MNYNTELINVQFALINAFMIGAEKNILDVSYSKVDDTILIQVVVLKGTFISEELKDKVNLFLPDCKITMKEVFLTKDSFNENKGDWRPKHYDWLENLLFSKSEVL